MKKFSELGITPEINYLIGDKIKIDRVLNCEIVVEKYEIKNSKFDGDKKCLGLQILFKDNRKIIFTGSSILIKMIEKVNSNDFPFETTIIKVDDYFQFS